MKTFIITLMAGLACNIIWHNRKVIMQFIMQNGIVMQRWLLNILFYMLFIYSALQTFILIISKKSPEGYMIGFLAMFFMTVVILFGKVRTYMSLGIITRLEDINRKNLLF